MNSQLIADVMSLGPDRLVLGIVILTLRVTLLSDLGYALIGYEYCARIMRFDDYRFAFEPVSAPRPLTNTQGMQINCSLYFFRRAWNA